MNYAVVIVAGGKSTRFKADVNKLLYMINENTTVIDKTISVFDDDPDCKQIVVVCGEDVMNHLAKERQKGKIVYAYGGVTRSDSVMHGLMAVTQDYVMVHDGARCFLEREDLENLKKALEVEQGAMLVQNMTDSVKKVVDGYVVCSLDRDELKRAQTPQAFKTEQLYNCYLKAEQDNYNPTDDAAIMEKYSDIKIKCVVANGSNIKITTINDVKFGG